jgi:transposase
MDAKSFAGIDLHKTTLTIAVTNSAGELTDVKPFPTKCVDKIDHFFSHLPSPVHCAIESVGMYEWLWEHLEPRVDKLILADAVELRYRAGKRRAKTDKIDAKFISQLLFKGDIPEAFAPDKTLRELRRLGRHWQATGQMLAEIKIRMKWILIQHNFPGPNSITGASAQKWFLSWGDKLSPMAQLSFSQFLETIEHIERQRVIIRRQILEFCSMDRFRDDVILFKTVPGIADISAAIIIGEVAGFERFYSADAIASYTGLTERTNESAGKVSQGHISKQGSPVLRWVLCEAANTLIRSDHLYSAMYNRILRTTKDKSKARIAMSQRLIRWLWKMHQTREPFRRGESTQHTKGANRARAKIRKNRLNAGMELQTSSVA